MTETGLQGYWEGLLAFGNKMLKKINLFDLGAIKYICFVTGILFAFCFPRMTKKMKPFFAVTGIIVMIPTFFKMIKTMNDIFYVHKK